MVWSVQHHFYFQSICTTSIYFLCRANSCNLWKKMFKTFSIVSMMLQWIASHPCFKNATPTADHRSRCSLTVFYFPKNGERKWTEDLITILSWVLNLWAVLFLNLWLACFLMGEKMNMQNPNPKTWELVENKVASQRPLGCIHKCLWLASWRSHVFMSMCRVPVCCVNCPIILLFYAVSAFTLDTP